jgi:hypothetical protein
VLAQDQISRPIQPVELFRFDSGSGVGAAWGPVQVGGYHGTLLSDPTSPSITLYCVDFVHSASAGALTVANTTNLGSATDATMPFTRLGNGAGNLAKYQQAAYLSALFESYASATAAVKKAAWSGIHAAIWSIMTPGFPGDATQLGAHAAYISDVALAMSMAQPFIAQVQAAAAAGYAGFDFSQWSVLTDANKDLAGSGQEFLVRTSLVTPEPQTVILLLSGLFVLLGVQRKRLSMPWASTD